MIIWPAPVTGIAWGALKILQGLANLFQLKLFELRARPDQPDHRWQLIGLLKLNQALRSSQPGGRSYYLTYVGMYAQTPIIQGGSCD